MKDYTNLELRGYEILEYLNEYLYMYHPDFDANKYFEGKTEASVNVEKEYVHLTFYIPNDSEKLTFKINSNNWEFGSQLEFNELFNNQFIIG